MPRSKLSKMSIAALQQEIERRQKMLPKLIAQRYALTREIEALQGVGAQKPAAAPPAKKRKLRHGRNKVALADVLARAMQGKDKVTVAEATQAAMNAGYKTKSRNFRSVVNNMLLSDKRFKNVARGVFTLKA